jgi:hypothetical protein
VDSPTQSITKIYCWSVAKSVSETFRSLKTDITWPNYRFCEPCRQDKWSTGNCLTQTEEFRLIGPCNPSHPAFDVTDGIACNSSISCLTPNHLNFDGSDSDHQSHDNSVQAARFEREFGENRILRGGTHQKCHIHGQNNLGAGGKGTNLIAETRSRGELTAQHPRAIERWTSTGRES